MVRLIKRYARLCGLFFLLALQSVDAEWKPYIVAEYFTHGESASIDTVKNDWEGPLSAGERHYESQWYEAGVHNGSIGVGAFIRSDLYIKYSEETAEFINSVVNGGDLSSSRTYEIDMEAYGMKSTGARFFIRPDLHENFNAEIGLSIMRANYLLAGTLSGYADAINDDSYSYALDVDYLYSEDELFEREVGSVIGYGLTVDVSTQMRLTPKLIWATQVRDLFGAIYWPEAPNTIAQANSNRVTISDAGYVEWDPLVSGLETNEDYLQSLIARVNSTLIYRPGSWQVGLGGQYWNGDLLMKLGAGRQFGNVELETWYWLDDNGFEISGHYRKLSVGLSSDGIWPDDIKTLRAFLNYNY